MTGKKFRQKVIITAIDAGMNHGNLRMGCEKFGYVSLTIEMLVSITLCS